MTILFDLFIHFPDMGEDMNMEDKAVFDEIISYFEMRLEPLKSEIEAEEATNPEQNSCTIIHLLPPKKEWSMPKQMQSKQIRITSHGYTDKLKAKMEGSFNNNDFIILNQKLETIAAQFRN